MLLVVAMIFIIAIMVFAQGGGGAMLFGIAGAIFGFCMMGAMGLIAGFFLGISFYCFLGGAG